MMLKAALITIIMLVIVALIISAANDYMEGRIRIRFEDFENDHICEHCGDQINIDHPDDSDRAPVPARKSATCGNKSGLMRKEAR